MKHGRIVKVTSLPDFKENDYISLSLEDEFGTKIVIPKVKLNVEVSHTLQEGEFRGNGNPNEYCVIPRYLNATAKLKIEGDIIASIDRPLFFITNPPEKEMTISDIEKQLGHRVKIVNEVK